MNVVLGGVSGKAAVTPFRSCRETSTRGNSRKPMAPMGSQLSFVFHLREERVYHSLLSVEMRRAKNASVCEKCVVMMPL